MFLDENDDLGINFNRKRITTDFVIFYFKSLIIFNSFHKFLQIKNFIPLPPWNEIRAWRDSIDGDIFKDTFVALRVREGHGREKQSQSSLEYRGELSINFLMALAFIAHSGRQPEREGVSSSRSVEDDEGD